MITKRPAQERGHANHGWLDTWHTFSFARYYDPEHMGFRDLRVINDDVVAPGAGFGTHPHDNMEIVTYVLEGALEHKDSLGTGSVLRPGDVQRMSAGTGVTHSEFNHFPDKPLRLLQIWILPAERGIAPGYEEKTFAAAEKRGRLRLIVSPDGRDGSLRIHQDVAVHASILGDGETVSHALAPGRHAWVQVARGTVTMNGVELGQGDGAAVGAEDRLEFAGRDEAEFLVFDLA
ncbi:MAG: pirin family protein [Krumholzibacteria bacterium]|nr:pirin family protein [Candidatus Krumholzibacteria bacterium]